MFRERLGETVGRQRAMHAEGHLLLVLHTPPQKDADERHGRFFWREPAGQWRSSDLGAGPGALKAHLDQYATIVEKFDEQDEQALSAEDYFAILEGLAPVHRAARHLHQALQEAREAVPQDRALINFRDQAYAIERQADLVYTSAKNGLEFAVAKRSEDLAHAGHRMSVSAHRLNLLAAFFFPLATLASIFGISGVAHPLENGPAPWTFLGLVGVGLISGIVLTVFIMRKPRPLHFTGQRQSRRP